MSLTLDQQIACAQTVPELDSLRVWAETALAISNRTDTEITIRFVESQESLDLNYEYRGKDKPTNVLSFPFECPPEIELDFLGDLVICPEVVEQEAGQQNKQLSHHYAHLVMHGVLHLLGYDHIDPEQANEMESIETRLLAKLGIDDPYQDH